MEFSLLDGVDDGKHNGMSFVEIVFAMQSAFSFEMAILISINPGKLSALLIIQTSAIFIALLHH